MIGFIFFLLAARQIYIIIKNGLTARQIKEVNSGEGVLALIVIKESDFINFNHLKELALIPAPHKIQFITSMDHPQIVELNNYNFQIITYNKSLESPVDVINNISLNTEYNFIVISDSSVRFQNEGLFGIEKLLQESKGPYCIIPQVHSRNLTVNCLYSLNPQLALISLLSFKRLTRAQKHPLLNISELSIAYRKIDFKLFPDHFEWKSSLFKGFHSRAIGMKLCFGEIYFSLSLPTDLKSLWQKVGKKWQESSNLSDYTSISLLIQTILWSFPFLFYKAHPFYSISIFILLTIYRIFTLIIFQENIFSLFVHPFAGLMWLGAFIWDRGQQVKRMLSKT